MCEGGYCRGFLIEDVVLGMIVYRFFWKDKIELFSVGKLDFFEGNIVGFNSDLGV